MCVLKDRQHEEISLLIVSRLPHANAIHHAFPKRQLRHYSAPRPLNDVGYSGKRDVRSRTSSRTRAARVASSAAERTVSISSAIRTISRSFIPRVVTAEIGRAHV